MEEVKDVAIFKTRKHEYLGFAIKEKSHLESNQAKYVYRIPQLKENDANWIIIDSDVAKIESEKLPEHLRKNINAANAKIFLMAGDTVVRSVNKLNPLGDDEFPPS